MSPRVRAHACNYNFRPFSGPAYDTKTSLIPSPSDHTNVQKARQKLLLNVDYRLCKALLKITIAIMPGVPLTLHECVQLTQPCNTTAELQWLHGVVD